MLSIIKRIQILLIIFLLSTVKNSQAVSEEEEIIKIIDGLNSVKESTEFKENVFLNNKNLKDILILQTKRMADLIEEHKGDDKVHNEGDDKGDDKVHDKGDDKDEYVKVDGNKDEKVLYDKSEKDENDESEKDENYKKVKMNSFSFNFGEDIKKLNYSSTENFLTENSLQNISQKLFLLEYVKNEISAFTFNFEDLNDNMKSRLDDFSTLLNKKDKTRVCLFPSAVSSESKNVLVEETSFIYYDSPNRRLNDGFKEMKEKAFLVIKGDFDAKNGKIDFKDFIWLVYCFDPEDPENYNISLREFDLRFITSSSFSLAYNLDDNDKEEEDKGGEVDKGDKGEDDDDDDKEEFRVSFPIKREKVKFIESKFLICDFKEFLIRFEINIKEKSLFSFYYEIFSNPFFFINLSTDKNSHNNQSYNDLFNLPKVKLETNLEINPLILHFPIFECNFSGYLNHWDIQLQRLRSISVDKLEPNDLTSVLITTHAELPRFTIFIILFIQGSFLYLLYYLNKKIQIWKLNQRKVTSSSEV